MRAIPNRVGLSGGPGRALSNIGAVRAGLLNVLITDQDTAAGMLAILNAEEEFQASRACPNALPGHASPYAGT